MSIIKSYYRNLKKQKLIYAIIIGGFAISLAVLILIVSFIQEEKSVDKHLPNFWNMYRVEQADGNAQIPKRVYEPVLVQAPEIEKLCLINANKVLYEYKNEKKECAAISTNKEFIDVFSINIIHGQRHGLLEAKTDVLITQSFAKRIFGDENPIGEVLDFGNKEKKIIKAIVADPLKTSSLKYDVIFNLEQDLFHSTQGYNQESYLMHNAVFVLNKNAKPAEIENRISGILKNYEGYNETLLKIQPFREVYFDTKSKNDRFLHANVNMIKLLFWVATIILLLAIINYVNLNTAFNNERYKEICIRKTSGARRGTIFIQFLKESYISCFIASFLAVIVASLISPLFEDLFGREIVIWEALKKQQVLLSVFLLLLTVGGIAGVLPAWSIARFNPIDLLQRRMKMKSLTLRGFYNAFQLSVTICLIIGLIIIVKQINYVKTKDVGFNKECLLNIRLLGKTYSNSKVIKEMLFKYPNIINVSGTTGRPFGIYGTSSGSWNSDSIEYRIENMSNLGVDTSFLSTFGIELIKGRNFRATDREACIINEKMYKKLRLNTIDGQTIWGANIVGVVKDFHFKKMYDELGFIQLKYTPNKSSHLNIKIRGIDIHKTLGIIKSTLREFEPKADFNPVFYDDWINEMYQKEERQAKAIKIFATIALVLSCLGLLGFAKFLAEKRTKEIGIRKVNGATISEVMTMLNRDFVKWVAIAFVIATPIAYFAMHKWLENFAYKTNLSWWIFALAGVLALGIALLTVSFQSWKAATKNPVESLRYE